MPLCYCYTNIKDSDIPKEFEQELSKLVADVLNKPENRITVMVQPTLRMCRNGSTDPAFILQIHSIKVFDEERNPTYFPKFFDFLTKALKLEAKQITIEFVDLAGNMAKAGE